MTRKLSLVVAVLVSSLAAVFAQTLPQGVQKISSMGGITEYDFPNGLKVLKINGKLPGDERNDIINRVRFTDTLDDLAECDLVVEAAIEDEDAKTAIFAALGKVVRPDALLTSNTSSIPIMKLAAVTPGPERVVGMHFFNPATVLPLVEVIPCER